MPLLIIHSKGERYDGKDIKDFNLQRFAYSPSGVFFIAQYDRS